MTDRRIIVVDASVAVKWLLPEPGREAAAHLLDLYESEQVDLIAPTLIQLEVANVLSKRCRQRRLDRAMADTLFAAFQLRAPRLIETPDLLRRSLELSLRHAASFWDCVYLALAIESRADLVTADRRFYRSVERYYPFTSLISHGG